MLFSSQLMRNTFYAIRYAIFILYESLVHFLSTSCSHLISTLILIFSDMLPYGKAIICCIAVRMVVTQGQRPLYRPGQNIAFKPAVEELYTSDSLQKSDVGCSNDYGCSSEGDSLLDTIANIDTELLCQQLCQVICQQTFYHEDKKYFQ